MYFIPYYEDLGSIPDYHFFLKYLKCLEENGFQWLVEFLIHFYSLPPGSDEVQKFTILGDDTRSYASDFADLFTWSSTINFLEYQVLFPQCTNDLNVPFQLARSWPNTCDEIDMILDGDDYETDSPIYRTRL